jgi:hypothetical protein
MTSDEVKARLWEAYKAGIAARNRRLSVVVTQNYDQYRTEYDRWLVEEMPEVAYRQTPYFDKDAEDGKVKITHIPDLSQRYLDSRPTDDQILNTVKYFDKQAQSGTVPEDDLDKNASPD